MLTEQSVGMLAGDATRRRHFTEGDAVRRRRLTRSRHSVRGQRGYTELTRMTKHSTPDGDKSLAPVRSQSERMTTLGEDLLVLARLDEGQPLEVTALDLTRLAVERAHDKKVIASDCNWCRPELPD
jgi:signal transduction histidine kinase